MTLCKRKARQLIGNIHCVKSIKKQQKRASKSCIMKETKDREDNATSSYFTCTSNKIKIHGNFLSIINQQKRTREIKKNQARSLMTIEDAVKKKC